MYIYIIFFLTSIVCSLKSIFIERDKAFYLFSFCATLLGSYVCLRFQVGADWNHYQGIYDMAGWDSVFANNKAEPLFMVMCILFKYLHLDFYVLSACIGLVTSLLFFKSIKDYSSYPLLTLSLLVVPFIYIGVTQIRQGLSLALILFALRYVISRNYLAYFSLILIAIGFHYSAILGVVFFFCHRAFSAKQIFIFSASVLVVSLLQIIFDISYLDLLKHLTFGHVKYKLEAYLLDGNGRGITLYSSLWRMVIVGVAWYNYYKGRDKFSLLYFNIYLFGLAVYLLNSAAPVLAARGSFYCKIFECFILSKLVYDLKVEKKQLLAVIVTLISFSYYGRQLYYFNINHMDQYYVYKSYIPWVQTMLDRVSFF